jgi:hypothetical protein
LISFYEHRKHENQPSHFVSLYRVQEDRWYTAVVMFDGYKGKWTDSSMVRDYGTTYRADKPNQWWTREGFRKLYESNKIDDGIPAVTTARFRFFGRDEAIKRLKVAGILEL